MVNYSNGKIYKLVNNVDDKVYVGSTCATLRLRKSKHKQRAGDEKYKNMEVYKHLNYVGWSNVEIILIEAYECKCKDELHARERHFIDELKPELNKIIPTRTKKEYYEENKEHENERNKAYQREHREEIRQKRSVKTICECGGKYVLANQARHMKTKRHIKFVNLQ